MKICVVCSDPLTGRQQLYCKPLCASKGFNASRKADGRLKAYREANADKRAEWQRENKARYIKTATCQNCGKGFTHSQYIDQATCGWLCAQQMRHGKCRLPAIHPARILLAEKRRQPTESIRKPRLWVMGYCNRCDAAFIIRDQLASRYCSEHCSDRDAKDRRRAMKRAAFVAPVYRARIFKRDKWICQLCMKPVVRTAVVPHPLAPTIDHIIPLGRDGTHEPANAQCAHFICNSAKGDRGGGEQLALIG